jgi:hypothetical protein
MIKCKYKLLNYDILNIIILSLVTFKIFTQYHIINFDDVILRFQYLLDGKPDWKTYQNRILGPFLISGLDLIVNDYKKSYILFCGFFIFINNILFDFILKNIFQKNTKESFFYLLIYNVLFLFYQHHFIYPWDFIEISLITILIFIIIKNSNLLNFYLIILFFIGLLNKESALIIPFFLSLIYILEKNFIKLSISIFLTFFGYQYIRIIRNKLFIERIGGEMSYEFHPVELLNNLSDFFIKNIISPRIAFTIFTIGYFIYLIKNLEIIKFNKTLKYLLIYFLIHFSFIFTFGIFMETRTQLVLLPICLIVYIKIKKIIFNKTKY